MTYKSLGVKKILCPSCNGEGKQSANEYSTEELIYVNCDSCLGLGYIEEEAFMESP